MAASDASAEHPYDRHVGRYGAQLAAGLIGFAGVRSGERVLDVGCGTGQLTRQLAATVGAENVAAIDPAEDAVEVCRARVPGADIRVGEAEAVPFAAGEFDVVLAQLVVNLVHDPASAVAEMARVAKPGACVAACLWDDEEMPLLRSFWDAAEEVAPGELADVSDQARVGLADPELLRGLWETAGLEEVALGEFHVTADYAGFNDLWAPFEAGIGHSGGFCVSLDGERQSALRASAHRRLGAPEGGFRLTAGVHTVRGTR
jgi:SAM-dependent methyltransferase